MLVSHLLRSFALFLIIICVAAAVGWAALSPKPFPNRFGPLPNFAPQTVAEGETLAKVGGCGGCHTKSGGPPYGGGRAIETPFGVLYSSNITPDRDTGVGKWTLEAFRRAMRDGVSQDGSYRYPAFPYDHYRLLSDHDIEALYAFIMTRTAVTSTPAPNRLTPPFNFRPLIAVWQLLFLNQQPLNIEPERSEQWNRGRYLVKAVGHCGSCHTPRNWLGAEDGGKEFSGGWSEGWYAPPINATSPAPRRWNEDDLFEYLRTGVSRVHAAAAGPMGDVTRALASAPEGDLRAMATYFSSLMGDSQASRSATPDHVDEAAKSHSRGARLFAGACAVCHDKGAPMMVAGARPALSLGTPLYESQARDTIAIIQQGLKPPSGLSGPFMPAFADDFNDADIADLIAYLRARFTDQPPWTEDLESEVKLSRTELTR